MYIYVSASRAVDVVTILTLEQTSWSFLLFAIPTPLFILLDRPLWLFRLWLHVSGYWQLWCSDFFIILCLGSLLSGIYIEALRAVSIRACGTEELALWASATLRLIMSLLITRSVRSIRADLSIHCIK